jgi:hypothetical protein
LLVRLDAKSLTPRYVDDPADTVVTLSGVH